MGTAAGGVGKAESVGWGGRGRGGRDLKVSGTEGGLESGFGVLMNDKLSSLRRVYDRAPLQTLYQTVDEICKLQHGIEMHLFLSSCNSRS